MQVQGVGAGPRGPHGGPPPQAAAHRPQRSQAPAPTGGPDAISVTPLQATHPPAHGVRRLMEAGHFAEGSSAYTAHAAKFGPPPSALATDTPADELPTGDTPLEQPATTEPTLLDLDTLLMEQLIAEQEAPPTLLETLTHPAEEEPPAPLPELMIDTTEDTQTPLEEIVESIEEISEAPSA